MAGANETIVIEASGERVYPCRCGVTHRGPYGAYDYAHHNCFHDVPLIDLDAEDPGHLLCPACGKSFRLDKTDRSHPA